MDHEPNEKEMERATRDLLASAPVAEPELRVLPIFRSSLSGWDVVAALVGLAVGALLLVPLNGAPNVGQHVLFIGTVLLTILARRRFLPRLSPPVESARPPLTLGQRLLAYGLMVGGGFVMLFSGVAAGVAMFGKSPLGTAIATAVFACAGWVALEAFASYELRASGRGACSRHEARGASEEPGGQVASRHACFLQVVGWSA